MRIERGNCEGGIGHKILIRIRDYGVNRIVRATVDQQDDLLEQADIADVRRSDFGQQHVD